MCSAMLPIPTILSFFERATAGTICVTYRRVAGGQAQITASAANYLPSVMIF